MAEVAGAAVAEGVAGVVAGAAVKRIASYSGIIATGRTLRSEMLKQSRRPQRAGFVLSPKRICLAAVLVTFAAPVYAAEFYVVQDNSTKRCTIVEQRPTTTTSVVVGGGVFTTRTEAESSLKTTKVCSDSVGSSSTTTTTTTRP